MAELQQHETLCVGGDFAGLYATFDQDGNLVPIPDHLIPEEMLQWGQEPSSLQVLVSEVWDKQIANSESSSLMERQTITILPAIGCAIDNLDTIKKEESFEGDKSWWYQPCPSVVCFDVPMNTELEGEKRLRLETIFSLRDSHRLRIGFCLKMLANGEDADAVSYSIQYPFMLFFERQIDRESSRGARAMEGLDGRTVKSLLGDRIWTWTSFDKRIPELQGKWDPESQWLQSPESIRLPGNITISHGRSPHIKDEWLLEISLFRAASTDNPLMGARSIVRRRFQSLDSPEYAFAIESGEYKT